MHSNFFKAYLLSPDQDFVTYIKGQKDWIRDNPTQTYDYKQLMRRAKDKADSLEQDLLKKEIGKPKDDLVALQTELKNQKKVINKITKRAKQEAKQDGKKGSGGGGGNNGKKKKKDKKDYVPFPDELKKKAAPDDPSKPLVISGVSYWYCKEHKKWGRHSTKDCRKKEDSGGDDGRINNRAVRALAAIQD